MKRKRTVTSAATCCAAMHDTALARARPAWRILDAAAFDNAWRMLERSLDLAARAVELAWHSVLVDLGFDERMLPRREDLGALLSRIGLRGALVGGVLDALHAPYTQSVHVLDQTRRALEVGAKRALDEADRVRALDSSSKRWQRLSRAARRATKSPPDDDHARIRAMESRFLQWLDATGGTYRAGRSLTFDRVTSRRGKAVRKAIRSGKKHS